MNNEVISIIIPCYNDANYIEQAVNSACTQTYKNKEVIVVDDGSNKETKEILRKLEPKLDKLITQSNYGQSKARNIGIAAAKGEYILVLDSDDYFEPTFCGKALKKIQSNKNIKLLGCYASLLYDDLSKKLYKPLGGNIDSFMYSNAAMGSVLFKKLDWQKTGGYDEEMKSGFEDWEFYIRLLKVGGEAHIIKEPLFNYRKRKDSTTSKANAIKFELWQYIFLKHSELYKENYPSLIHHFINQLQLESNTKLKREKSIDYVLGAAILKPLRFLKRKVLRN